MVATNTLKRIEKKNSYQLGLISKQVARHRVYRIKKLHLKRLIEFGCFFYFSIISLDFLFHGFFVCIFLVGSSIGCPRRETFQLMTIFVMVFLYNFNKNIFRALDPTAKKTMNNRNIDIDANKWTD